MMGVAAGLVPVERLTHCGLKPGLKSRIAAVPRCAISYRSEAQTAPTSIQDLLACREVFR
jgi:hypothetical protein